jgi:hypothetical protein
MPSRLLKLMGTIPTPPLINYRASDDLELLFYIFPEFTIMYGGAWGELSEGVHPDNAHVWREPYVGYSSGILKNDFITDAQVNRGMNRRRTFELAAPSLKNGIKQLEMRYMKNGMSLREKSSKS